jgi:hypothetical protein
LLLQLLDRPESRLTPAALDAFAAFSARDWADFELLLQRHRVTRRAISALADAGVNVPQRLRQKANQIAFRAMERLAEAGRAQSVLAAHGIGSVPLKGPVLSQTLYGDPTFRESRDLDILVAREDFGAALELLMRECHYACAVRPPQSSAHLSLWLDAHKDVTLTSPQNLPIELHHRLTAVKALLPSIGLKQATSLTIVGPMKFAQFDRLDLFVYLCVHGSVSRWHRLLWIADIHEILTASSNEEIRALCDHAAKRGVTRCVEAAILLRQQLWKPDAALPDILPLRSDRRRSVMVANSIKTIKADDYHPGGMRALLHRLILRDGWEYRLSVLQEFTSRHNPDWPIVAYRFGILNLPLRLALWLKRRVARILG